MRTQLTHQKCEPRCLSPSAPSIRGEFADVGRAEPVVWRDGRINVCVVVCALCVIFFRSRLLFGCSLHISTPSVLACVFFFSL